MLAGLAQRWRPTILFVVDRSTDRTLERLRAIAAADPRVRVLALSNRFGQQMALLAGLDHCDSGRRGDDGRRPAAPAGRDPNAPGGARAGLRRRLHRARGHPRRALVQAGERAAVLPAAQPHLGDAGAPGRRRLPPGLAAGRRGLPGPDPRARRLPARAVQLGGLPQHGRDASAWRRAPAARPSTRSAACSTSRWTASCRSAAPRCARRSSPACWSAGFDLVVAAGLARPLGAARRRPRRAGPAGAARRPAVRRAARVPRRSSASTWAGSSKR